MNISKGIFEHCTKMKESVWLFMWLIDKQTKESGEVLFSEPVTYEKVKLDIPSLTLITYRRWVKKLQVEGYISVRRAPFGLLISITNPKKHFKGYIKNDTSDVSNMTHRVIKNDTSQYITLNKTNNTPPTPKGDLSIFIEEFNKLFNSHYVKTKTRQDKLDARLKQFPMVKIMTALSNMAADSFYQGEGPRGWKADPDFFLRNDEQIDKFFNKKIVEKSPFSPGFKLYNPMEDYS